MMTRSIPDASRWRILDRWTHRTDRRLTILSSSLPPPMSISQSPPTMMTATTMLVLMLVATTTTGSRPESFHCHEMFFF